MAMEMQVSAFEGATLVTLKGRLDTAGVHAIETAFAEAIVGAGRNAVVDLTEVSFLASLGIRMFLTTARNLAAKGGKLAMCNASPFLIDVIEMTSLQEIIPLMDSPAEAVELMSR
jgi:anti-anti-sigma factor